MATTKKANVSKNRKKEIPFNLHTIILSAIYIIFLFLYGGFHEITIVIAGIFAFVALLLKKGISITVSQGIFGAFSLWYLGCSLQNGFFVEYMARGLIPLVVFGFWIYISNSSVSKEKALDIITEASMWLALIAIGHCVKKCSDAHSLQRLSLPFDYSNVCGIYFAVMYFLSSKNASRFLRGCRFVFLTALILTQSVGAVGLFVLVMVYELTRNKKYIPLILGAVAFAVLGVVLKGRIIQSMGTFLERLLHIRDGLVCIARNPITGIGAGWWEIAKQYYQTGFYEAKVIHSSVITIGVNSGIIGLGLFLTVCILEFRKAFIQRKNVLLPIVILIHALLDFSLSFFTVSILILLLIPDFEEKTYTLGSAMPKSSAVASILCFAFILTGIFSSLAFQKKTVRISNPDELCREFNSSFFLKSSVHSSRTISGRMYQTKHTKDVPDLKKFKYMPTEMILLNSFHKGGEAEYLLSQLRKYPYNTMLKKFIIDGYGGTFEKKTLKIASDAGHEGSFFGKILYDLKGENK